jgi:Cu/Ag efflux protein CusF
MRTVIFTSGLLVAIALVVAGCQKTSEAPQAKQYQVNGKVVAIDTDHKTVTLDHEDIPGLMKGMEMRFKVENPQVLEGIAVGDQVSGQLEVQSGDHIIKELNKR